VFLLGLVLLVLCVPLSSPLYAAQADAEATVEAELVALVARAEEYIAQSRYDEAITLLNEIWLLAGDPRESALARSVLNTLANLHYNTGQLELAERYFQELVDLDTANNDLAALSVSLFNLGHVAGSDARYTDASAYFLRALDLSKQLGDASGAAYTLKALGVNAQAQVDLPAARGYLEAALEEFMQLGDAAQSAMVQRNLGDLALDEGEAVTATEYYYAALPVLADLGLNSPLLRAYRGLSLALEKLGQWEKSLIAQRAYTDLLQSTLEQQGSDATQRLQFELDTRRYADANARLQSLSDTQQEELAASLSAQRLQYLVLFLGAVLLVLLGLMYTRSRKAAEQMHALAITDELTLLPNRRAIMDHGEREWHRTLRSGETFACMVLDVDHFKKINDTFGHPAGDVVLRAIADTLRSIARQYDMIGRVGGEEFLLLAAGADARHALGLAERIRARVELAQIAAIGNRPLTLSIGIACRTRETSLGELIQHADKALYQAKHNGRNRAIIYQPEKVRPQLTVLEGGIQRS
jgi:diguanylate cyclase (GGDEF)-like protein